MSPPTDPPAVELAELCIGYRSRRRAVTVASGLTGHARRGELTVLIGPNGAGKSTLIRTLAGLQPALAGQVMLDGTALSTLPRDELARRVAVVLTDRIDPGLLCAREVVGLGRIAHLGLAGRLRPADERIIDWAMAATGAQHLAARRAAELSDGECQRILIARALAQQPALLILDEPTAFLDVPSRAGLFGLLRNLARDHRLAVLLSSHDLELALRVADRVWLIDPEGGFADTVGEQLMLSGRIGALFGTETLRFDNCSGTFELHTRSDSSPTGIARIDAGQSLRSALERVLSREGWEPARSADDPADMVLNATDPDAIAVRTCTENRVVALRDLALHVRATPVTTQRCVTRDRAVAALAELSSVNSYFAVATTLTDDVQWLPVHQLYSDTTALSEILDDVRRRIGTADLRVAASVFHLGYAARLFSIGLGMFTEHRLLIDLDPAALQYAQRSPTMQLGLPSPVAWQISDCGESNTIGSPAEQGPATALTDTILTEHLRPLADATRRIVAISDQLLEGNTASAALGAALALHRHRGGELALDPAWRLTRDLLSDHRLVGAIAFGESPNHYRRNSCCLYYRVPGGGLCGDCALTTPNGNRRNRAAD